ncbi:MAG TPA: universal stress protein, partial [Gemmatimonadaceae bacterium]|nr:universal stress protein [Gemmatimonadaceae bacterium]
LHLVHVRPEIEIVPAHATGWDRAYEETAHETLERVANTLRDSNVTVETHVVAGTVAQKITGFAYSRRLGLIAAGRQSRGVVERLFIGSSATQIIRAADCSVLIVPPESGR